jgi:very-short-patch-repair endonuclease
MGGPVYYTATDQRCESSAVEQEIIRKLQDLGIPLVPQVKLGNNWVFDGAINGTTIIVEIHGDYWHERPEVKERDGRKQEWADLNGYLILTIWEREYAADKEGSLLTILEHYEAAKDFIAPDDDDTKHGKHGMDHLRRSDYGEWHEAFLAALAETGIILDACEFANVNRETVRRHRRENTEFNEAFKDARRDAADRLRRRYHTRAEQQSDRAMEFLLKSLDPDEYGDGNAALLQGLMQYLDLSKLTNEQIDRLTAGDDPIRVLLGG